MTQKDELLSAKPTGDELKYAEAGLRPDDLVVLLGSRLIQSCKSLRAELEYVDFEDHVTLTVLRGQELLEFVLQAPAGK